MQTSNFQPNPEGPKRPGSIHRFEAAQLFGGKEVVTHPRFSLVRQGEGSAVAQDLIIDDPIEGFNRVLIVEASPSTKEIYIKLEKGGVPQLPFIGDRDNGKSLMFGVVGGSKPFSHESLHDRASTDTYISDDETFKQLGRMYGRAWKLTGALLLDPTRAGNESPRDHVAVRSFQDSGEDLMKFVPPYNPGIFSGLEQGTAAAIFNDSIRIRMEEELFAAYSTNPDDAERAEEQKETLVKMANIGFLEGVSQDAGGL
jgi:hypothetical protein